MRLQEIYEQFRDRAAFYFIYIREAHPIDGWQLTSNIAEQIEFMQTHTITERQNVATACAVGLRLTMPILIDGPDDTADLTFNAWPERLFVIARDGTLAYQGGKGPYHFDPDELQEFLTSYL